MKILVVQLRRLGDVLLTTPLLRALKTHLPNATVHLLVEPAHARILRGNPHVDEVIDPRGGPILAWRLRTARYDAVLDCLGTPGTARLAWLSGAHRRIGFRRPGRTAFYSQALDATGEPLYSALEKLLLARPLGVQETDCRLDLVVTPQHHREAEAILAGVGASAGDILVAFSPVSRRRDKAWPPDRFAALCDRWHTREGWRFLAMCGPGEEGQVRSVLRSARSPAAHLVPRTPPSLGGLRAVMESCRLYLGNDNAIRHIAIAASRPTAAVFGRPNPASWTPPGIGTHVSVGGGRPIHSVSLAVLDAALEKLVAELAERRPRRTENSRRS